MSLSRRTRSQNPGQNQRVEAHHILPDKTGKIRRENRDARNKTPVGVVILLVCLGIVCYGVLIAGAVVFLRSGPSSEPVKTLTREEFTQAVKGKTKQDIIGMLGMPTNTYRGSDDSETWTYWYRSRDAVTGRTDWNASIHLRDGKAYSVAFFE